MPKSLVVGTETFEVPLQGESPDYGESLTSFFEAIAEALSTVQQPNDVLTQSASIINNQTSAANIPGFVFDTTEVIAINGEYIVTRSTASPAVKLVESGLIQGNFDGSNWTYTIECVGDAGIDFSITAGGQITYTTTNMTGTSYSGEITFKAKVFNS